MPINVTINQTAIKAEDGQRCAPPNGGMSVLNAALTNGIYIPHLCSHPDLNDYKCLSCGAAAESRIPAGHRGSGTTQPSAQIYRGGQRIENGSAPDELGCQLCLVEIKGMNGLQKSCGTIITDGMEIITDTEQARQARRRNLSKILAEHPHSCLTCAQSQGCSLTQCSSNVPVNERCCSKFNKCELQKVAQYIGIAPETPRYVFPDITILDNEPLLKRNYNLCIGCLRCVRACAELRKAKSLGFVYYKNKAMVGSVAPTLAESNCHFCGICVEVCPTGALMDKIPVAGNRLADCQNTCPIRLDVPDYIRAIRENNPDKSLAIIRQKTPFPAVLGRVCFHPCETSCRRKEINEPIAICGLKRYASETGGSPQRTQSNQHHPLNPRLTVAVVGAGPAGLTAAYYLAQAGIGVTLYDAESEAGGMMRYALPEYRLPLDILHQEINLIISTGITFKPNMKLGRDFTVESLRNDGFKAILLALGAQLPKKIPALENNKCPDVVWGIDFLKAVRKGIPLPGLKDKTVLVIGGGNVAVDVALSARRLGAKDVTMVCLESRETMPAHPWEIEQAREEGVAIECSWGPDRITHNNGKPADRPVTRCSSPTGINSASYDRRESRQRDCEVIPQGADRGKWELSFNKCTAVFDQSGKFKPTFDCSAQKVIAADVIIAAVGQSPDNSSIGNITLTPTRTIKTDEFGMTNIPGIFACGELVQNPGSVVDAIAAGRKAAESIVAYSGIHSVVQSTPDSEDINNLRPDIKSYPISALERFPQQSRVTIPRRSSETCTKDFRQIETGFTSDLAKAEASRCLQCDLRFMLSPVILPPESRATSLEFNDASITTVKEAEGVYILFDTQHNILHIKGVMNLRQALKAEFRAKPDKAKFFEIEIDPMYTKRESELMQQYLQKHGKLPGGDSELDELY